MKSRKFLGTSLVGLAVVSVATLAGCGSTTAKSTNGAAQSGGSGSTGTGSVKTLRLAYIMATGNPADDAAKKFKELVEQQTNGSVKVVLAPNSQLGNEQDVSEGLKIGSIEMELSGDGPIGFFAPDYTALQVPFVMTSIQQMHDVFSGPIGQGLSQELLQKEGMHVLGYWDRLPRELTANKAVHSPADLSGMKMRVPTKLDIDAWKAIGASPTPIALGELYSALQQGVVEAQENPLDLIDTSHFNEVQKYAMMTNHKYLPYILSISEKVWQTLTPDQQKIIQDAANTAGQLEDQETAASQQKYQSDLQSKGMKFVTDVDVQAFEDKVKAAVPTMSKQYNWKPGLYDEITNTK